MKCVKTKFIFFSPTFSSMNYWKIITAVSSGDTAFIIKVLMNTVLGIKGRAVRFPYITFSTLGV